MDEQFRYSRRDFLRRSGCTAAGVAAIATGLDRLSLVNVMAAPTDYRALVCVFMSGGNDCNNMVIPLDAGYAAYSAIRAPAGLAIAEAALQGAAILPPALGVRFALHPSLGPA